MVYIISLFSYIPNQLYSPQCQCRWLAVDSCELFPAVEVASLVLKYLKNPPLARDTEEHTCLSIYQAGKKEYNKNWLRRLQIEHIIIHQTHYEKSDWSRAFSQFIIPCELDMINAISAADIAFIMSSSTSAWLLSPLQCSPQKQNG